jgi:hypothetical protein
VFYGFQMNPWKMISGASGLWTSFLEEGMSLSPCAALASTTTHQWFQRGRAVLLSIVVVVVVVVAVVVAVVVVDLGR